MLTEVTFKLEVKNQKEGKKLVNGMLDYAMATGIESAGFIMSLPNTKANTPAQRNSKPKTKPAKKN